MKSDFEIIERSFPREDIRIYALSDLHVGAKEFRADIWEHMAG